nr:NADH dehydrogenase subunit 5 [Ipomoea batatas]
MMLRESLAGLAKEGSLSKILILKTCLALFFFGDPTYGRRPWERHSSEGLTREVARRGWVMEKDQLPSSLIDRFLLCINEWIEEFRMKGASVAYNVNPVADQFQRAFQTSTFCNRLYSFFNKRWFFDQVLNDFLVRSFLRFGYEVSFEALDKGAIEILGPYGISYTFRRLAERISQLQSGFVVRRMRYDPWPPAWWGRLLRCG